MGSRLSCWVLPPVRLLMMRLLPEPEVIEVEEFISPPPEAPSWANTDLKIEDLSLNIGDKKERYLLDSSLRWNDRAGKLEFLQMP